MEIKNRTSKNIPIIEGKYVRIREVTYEDVDRIVSWRNDKKLGKFLQIEPLTREKQYEFLRHYFKLDNDFYFVAELKISSEPIGTVGFRDIDLRSKRAELVRLLVLAKYKLFSFEISYLALNFAFERLKLHKVYSQLQKENEKAHRFNLTLGFQQEGILKEHWWNGKKLDDVIFLSMFKDEYLKLKKKYQYVIEKKR